MTNTARTRPAPSLALPPDTRGLTTEWKPITPAYAADLLTRNTHNRPMRERVVASYAQDMRTGAWRENGDTIRIAHDGTILDGQHRLQAIVDSQTTQWMLLVTGLDMQVQETIDGGAKRTFADALKLRGEPNAATLAAVTLRVTLWEAGYRRPKAHHTPTNAQMLETLQRHPEIRDSVKAADATKRQIGIYASVLGLCHWVFHRIDPHDCAFFFDRLRDENTPGPATQPIGVLRRTMIQNSTGHARLSEIVITAYLIKTWNAFRDGREIGLLRWRPGGAQPEDFPEPR